MGCVWFVFYWLYDMFVEYCWEIVWFYCLNLRCDFLVLFGFVYRLVWCLIEWGCGEMCDGVFCFDYWILCVLLMLGGFFGGEVSINCLRGVWVILG